MTEAQAKYLRMIFCAECRHAIAAKVVATVGAILVSFPAMAQISCGELPKDLPVAVREQLKGDVEGKAQLLTKMLGDAQLKGKIETSRAELHQEHSNLDQHQIDMYFMWVACQALASDKTLSAAEKIALWKDVRATFNPRPLTALLPGQKP